MSAPPPWIPPISAINISFNIQTTSNVCQPQNSKPSRKVRVILHFTTRFLIGNCHALFAICHFSQFLSRIIKSSFICLFVLPQDFQCQYSTIPTSLRRFLLSPFYACSLQNRRNSYIIAAIKIAPVQISAPVPYTFLQPPALQYQKEGSL